MQKWKGLENSNGKIALKTLKWDCRVEDLHCRLISTQEYVNTSKETIEAVYTFSLQRGAVVADFCVVVNGRTLKARIAPRSSADENYESARNSGDMPVLLEHADEDIRTVSTSGIKPKEQVLVRIVSDSTLSQIDSSLRLAIPMVTAKRREPGGFFAKLLPHQFFENSFFVRYPIKAHFEFVGLAYVESTFSTPGFEHRCRRESDKVVLDVESGFADRDLVVAVTGMRPTSNALFFVDGSHYRGIVHLPIPRSIAQGPVKPLALDVVVDCSGSMSGAAAEQARCALSVLGGELSEHDDLRVFFAGSKPHAALGKPHACTAAFLRRDFGAVINAVNADRGQQHIALALAKAAESQTKPRDVLLVTNGAPSEIAQCLRLVRQSRQRIFVLGLGHAPNAEFCCALAKASAGQAAFAAPSESIAAPLHSLLARMRADPLELHAAAPAGVVASKSFSQGIFAGDVLTLYFKFSKIPNQIASVELCDGKQIFVIKSMRWKMVEDDGLLRLAAMHELTEAGVKDAAAFAQKYSLLTRQTSFVLVSERAAEQKSSHAPRLIMIPQMLPAFMPQAGGIGELQALSGKPLREGFLRFAQSQTAPEAPHGYYGWPHQTPCWTYQMLPVQLQTRAHRALDGLEPELRGKICSAADNVDVEKELMLLFYFHWLNLSTPSRLSKLFDDFSYYAKDHFDGNLSDALLAEIKKFPVKH